MKHFLIIGGSSGIGAAVCKQLNDSSHRVIATYNKNQGSSSENITFHPMDVTSSQYDLSFLPDALDGLVYCPGAINLKPFARIHPDDFLKDYQLQVLGAIRVIQQVLPHLKKSGNASIVLFSTVAVQTGFNFHSIVSSSKGAIEGLTRSLAAELSPYIRINAIAPSITETPLASGLLNTPEKKEANAQRHPLKKIGTPDDIASMVCFLLNDQSSWITGQILHIDGGMSAVRG
ncbi:MAG: SDR family oxidoreductase [Ferruginibacter sp.]|nr:SDR family oxidoreductase [Ferruginibacter sp.]